MNRTAGDVKCPIWIIGDSAPLKWKNVLNEPFDSRHPIRHNIITSVFDVIQDKVYDFDKSRIDMKKIYMRNAVENAVSKPDEKDIEWTTPILIKEMDKFKQIYDENKPRIILTFGAFSYEFVKRVINGSKNKYMYWTTKKLGEEFRNNILEDKETIILPLLHRSIAGGYFISGHNDYCDKKGANYFDEVGQMLADVIWRDFRKYKKYDIWK